MSNAQRIWIGYLAAISAPLILAGGPFLAMLLAAPPWTGAFGGLILGFLVYVIWSRLHGKCWRCNAKLFKGPGGIFYPIVLWRHCPSCGVRHASKPEDVRDNPIGHFR